MLFSSIPFLYYFLPAVLLCYLIAPRVLKNTVLLVFSLVFYAWGEPKYVFLMLASILVGYVAGLLIERFKGKILQKLVLVVAILLCAAGLLYFKYADFFIGNFNAVTGLSLPLLRLALPIGISFYTFQVISYLVDVYRGEVAAQKNPIHLATYVALFAQLIAGPIVRYTDIAEQLQKRKHTFDQCAEGVRRFMIGLSKKILIANILGELVDTFRGTDGPSVAFYWLYAVAYALHLYFDFSGYSDMAIGLGRIFGFRFLENFNYPFISKSITEFWRRWHMSLGQWFRDYVYIPLGGNRVGRVKWVRNILIVWMLTGFWHGADWNFILWGLLFAILLMIEKAGLGQFLKKHGVVAHLYVTLVILLSFALFNAGSLTQLGGDFLGLFGLKGLPLWTVQTGYYLRSYAVILLIALVGATPLPKKLAESLRDKVLGSKDAKNGEPSNLRESLWGILEAVVLVALLLICTAFLVDGSFNPFLYFRF